MHLTLCEYASVHTDLTFSVVRGGIAHWTPPASGFPFHLRLTALVEIPGGTVNDGEHVMQVVLSNGQQVALKADLTIKLEKPQEIARAALNLDAVIQGAGKHTLVVRLEQASVTAELDIRPPPA